MYSRGLVTALKVAEDGDTCEHIHMLNEQVVALFESVCVK